MKSERAIAMHYQLKDGVVENDHYGLSNSFSVYCRDSVGEVEYVA